MKFIKPNKYIADKGKVFIRISDGKKLLDEPIGYFENLELGIITEDKYGLPIDPFPDKIEYYQEIDILKENIKSKK